jgi:hypothetical protein
MVGFQTVTVIIYDNNRTIAHLQHGIRRVVILDVDLHHGKVCLMGYRSTHADIDITDLTGIRKWDPIDSMAD